MRTELKTLKDLPFNPQDLERELKEYYISATPEEIEQMLSSLGKKNLDDLFSDVDPAVQLQPDRFKEKMLSRLSYEELLKHTQEIALKNKQTLTFIGDGLPHFSTHPIIDYVCALRGLTTAYTPYQPERSQGTLYALWMYANGIRELTGFEAINASLYDRSTCLFEAMNTGHRISKKMGSQSVILSEGIYPGDLEVVETLSQETNLKPLRLPLNSEDGLTSPFELEKLIQETGPENICAVAFPQVNSIGLLEDVNALTDICWKYNIPSIAVIDPLLLASEGLCPPSTWGTDKQGANILVGEGQHLAIAPNFGGPGLGIFGIRYNDKEKMAIRSTAGRYVGKTTDEKGNEALCMVLSTREQHIRREKATSNICSNQSFVAALAGAALYARGDEGLSQMIKKARENALFFLESISSSFNEDFSLAYPKSSFFNQVCLRIKDKTSPEVLKLVRKKGIQLGIDVSGRVKNDANLLLISFSDIHSKKDIEILVDSLREIFPNSSSKISFSNDLSKYLRKDSPQIKAFELEELKNFYAKLSRLNLSPDDHLYPLGSCTMKYNPYINDFAAGLNGFTSAHPQAPEEDAQGCLEILHSIQECFKAITGLPGVTTQPVAGAQGELVGIKMFQAYHRDRGEGEQRNLILIPRSAHGTNPATATMAGFETKTMGGQRFGIVTIEANSEGQVDFAQLEKIVNEEGPRIAGIMVTNPNTAGILESQFKEMAALIHSVGGLVYMDGANMNAIAGYIDLDKLGVDAVHNNLHKTWTIPHGGGGPGDAIVAVSKRLIDYLPGRQIHWDKKEQRFYSTKAPKSIGSFHRHWGNFAHKVRAYTYLRALGPEGVRKMSAVAVLSARYLLDQLKSTYPTLPERADTVTRMHEFILTLPKEIFDKAQEKGVPKSQVIPKVGKLFLDFGLHAPTVAFPEVYGLMVEPTESFSKKELDEFTSITKSIYKLVQEHPEVLATAPHFTSIKKVDEVKANKDLILGENITRIPQINDNPIDPRKLSHMAPNDVCERILSAHLEG